MKVFVAVPAFDMVRTQFAASLADLAAFTSGTEVNYNGRLAKPEVAVAFCQNGGLDWKRTKLVKRARDWNADYVLWVDSDQTFPRDGFFRLAAHDLPIVGCNYVTREHPPLPVAVDKDSRRIRTTKALADAGKVEEVGALGLGFCLVKRRVFDLIEQTGQRLFLTHIENGQLVETEDFHFCHTAQRAGIPVYLDHALSWEIGHIAETVNLNSDTGVDDANSLPPASGP